MGRGLTALSAGALVTMMVLAVAAPAHAKPDETESTLGHGPRVVGR